MKEKIKALYQCILRYLIPYVWGILAAIAFTPVQLSLVGVKLWYMYPVLAVPAFFLFVFELHPRSLFGFETIVLMLYFMSAISILFGIGTHFAPLRRYRDYRPALITFPVGFIGTVGVYFISMASI